MNIKHFRPGLLALSLGLAACNSDESITPPAVVPDFDSKVSLLKVWEDGVGDGVVDEYVSLTPAVTDTHVYAAALDGTLVKDDRLTGENVWRIKTGHHITGGIAVNGRHIAYGTSDGELVVVSDDDGRELWKVALGGQVLSTPALSDSRVVAQTIDGRLHGYDPETGKRVWLYDTSIPILTMRGESSPMILGNVVIAGFANGKLTALQASDGFVGWEKAVAEPEGRSELERLVDIDGRFDVYGGNVFAATYQGKVASISIPNGRVEWARPISSHAGLSVASDTVFVTNDDSEVVALEAGSGNEQWRQSKLKGRSLSAPVAYDDYVVVGDFEGYLHWLDRHDGSFVARTKVYKKLFRAPMAGRTGRLPPLVREWGVRAPVVVRDSVVYVQSNDGGLAAYRIQTEKTQ